MIPSFEQVARCFDEKGAEACVQAARWLASSAAVRDDTQYLTRVMNRIEDDDDSFVELLQIFDVTGGWKIDCELFRRMLKLLKTLEYGENVCFGLEDTLLRAPLSVLQECRFDIENCEAVSEQMRVRIARMQQLANWTPKQLRKEAKRLDDVDESDFDGEQLELFFAEIDDLNWVVANCFTFTDADVLRLLEDPQAAHDGWFVVAVYAAGIRRLQSAAPTLLVKALDDDASVCEYAAEALRLIGSCSTIQQIEIAFENASEESRDRAALILEGIPSAESECAVLKLLERKLTKSTEARLSLSLVRLLSSEAERWAKPHVSPLHEIGFDIFAELPGSLAAQGKEPSQQFYEDLEDRMGTPDALPDNPLLDVTEPAPTFRSPIGELLNSVGDDESEEMAPLTFRNSYERVGRNDPCPCGSGKKFKKCCGKS